MTNTTLNIITPNRGFKYLADAEEEFRLAEQMLEQAKRQGKRKPKPATPTPPAVITDAESLDGFIYVPSISLYVSKQRTHQNLNWADTHEALKQENSGMLTIPQFISFVNYVKQHNPEIYEDITAVREPWRSEWLDAYFEKRKDVMYILTKNKSNSEKLESCLREDCQADIFGSANKQGLPTQKLNGFYYWYPRANRVARFNASSGRANLYCNRLPSGRDSALGVRATKSLDVKARVQTNGGSK